MRLHFRYPGTEKGWIALSVNMRESFDGGGVGGRCSVKIVLCVRAA